MEQRANFDMKYIIKQNIERVWGFVRDPKMFILDNSDPYYKCEILEGKFLWEKGSRFVTLRKSNTFPPSVILSKYFFLGYKPSIFSSFIKYTSLLHTKIYQIKGYFSS